MENEIYDIGSELVDYSRTAAEYSARGLVAEMFPFIHEASKRMSARAISRWLKEEKGIKLSDVSIAKALRAPGKYWTMLADEVKPLARAVEVGTGVSMQDFLFDDRLFEHISDDEATIFKNVDGSNPEEIMEEVHHVGFAVQQLNEIWFPLSSYARAAAWPYLAPVVEKEGEDGK